jgi:hypothetical protein
MGQWQRHPSFGIPVYTENIPGYGYSIETITDDPSSYIGEKEVLHTRYSYDERPCELNIEHNYSRTFPGYGTSLNSENFLWSTNGMKIGAMLRFGAGATRSMFVTDASHRPSLATVPISVQRSMMEQLLPKVNDGVSAVNFILELKDLRRQFDFKTIEHTLLKLGAGNFLTRRKMLRKSSKYRRTTTGEDIMSDYLNWNFGWKPFVGDLFAMYKALEGLGKRLDYLERHQGKLLRRRRGINLEVPELPSGVIESDWHSKLFYKFGPFSGGADLFIARRDNTWDFKPRYHATIDYTYTFPQGAFGETRRKIRGFLEALGIKINPQIIWNAIPFSFVVDWIIDVGGWLRQFSPNDLGMEVVIHDASHSVKWSQVATITCYAPINRRPATQPITTTINSYKWEVSTEERYYYERARWRPALELTDGFQLPTFMQFSLAGALAGTRDKRKYRHG